VAAVWLLRAADRGLDPGTDALAVMRTADVARRGLFDAEAVATILDALEGAARHRRERWQIRQLDSGVALIHDPGGARSSIRVPPAFRHLCDLERQAVILEDVERALLAEPGITLGRLAVRWAVGVRTLTRWRYALGHSRADVAAFPPESGETLAS
jgi:hypothetical protein